VPRAVLDTNVLVSALIAPNGARYVSGGEVDAFVELIRGESIVVDDPVPSPEPLSGDPDDEYLIDLAPAARVDALVTGDAHLVALREQLPVPTPREFLESLAAP